MSRERDKFKMERREIIEALSKLGPNFSSLSSLDSNHRGSSSVHHDLMRNIEGNLDNYSSSSNNNREAVSRLYREDDHKRDMFSASSRNVRDAHDFRMQSTSNLYSKPALSALGSAESVSIFSTGILSSEDSYTRMHDAESSQMNDIAACKSLTDINLRNVDEEDEFLYGDSNSAFETPKSFKMDPVESNIKKEAVWSDEEDLLEDSSNTHVQKFNPDYGKSSLVWNIRSNNADNKLSLKQEESILMKKNFSPETLIVEPLPLRSTTYQEKTQLASNRLLMENVKASVSQDTKMLSASGNKKTFHAAAQVLKKPPIEKFKNPAKQIIDSPQHNMNSPKDTEYFRSNVNVNKSDVKTNIPFKNLKSLNSSKSPTKNIKKPPRAFLQKDIDQIKDHIKGPERKRIHPLDVNEHDVKHARYEKYKDLSPSRYHFPYDSSRRKSPVEEYNHRPPYPIHKPKFRDPRYRSPPYPSKYKSPPRDIKRTTTENSPRHYEVRKHYSRSPSRKSRERSPDYYKYKARSPTIHKSRERSRSPGIRRSRERSRSPGYYKSRDQRNEYKYKKNYPKLYESSRKSTSENYHTKNKKTPEYSSEDSLSSFPSFISSDEHSDEKQKCSKSMAKVKTSENKKKLKMGCAKSEKKGLEDAHVTSTDTPISQTDIINNLADLCNFQDNAVKETDNNNDVQAFSKEDQDRLADMLEKTQHLSELFEGVQDFSTFASSVPPIVDVTPNMNLPVPNPAVLSLPFPQSYSVMPVSNPYPLTQVNTYPPPLPFPPPPVVAAAPPTSIYEPYSESMPAVEVSQTAEYKHQQVVYKRRPTTLRNIECRNVNSISTSPYSINKASSDEFSKSSTTKTIETRKNSALKEIKITDEKGTDEQTNAESNAERAAIIQKYKKLKTEKQLVHKKINSAVEDLSEMRKMLFETWGKKVEASDRMYYSKCKNILSICSDTMSTLLKDAKRFDEDLRKFKGKLPREVQIDLGNIKVEPPDEINKLNEFFSGYDSRNHCCYVCKKQPFSTFYCILEHFRSEEHKECLNNEDKEWTKVFKRPEETDEGRKHQLKPAPGIEFIKPLSGFYCSVCSDVLLDASSADQHLKSHRHFAHYMDYTSKNPLYEKKILYKRYVIHALNAQEKKKKNEEENLLKNKQLDDAEEKVKEMIRDEKSKEKVVEELEDEESSASNNQTSTDIKLTLSGEKEKKRENSKGTGTQNVKNKLSFIGKAPNFKPRPKPWYKGEIYQKNAESSSVDSSTVSNTSEKLTASEISSSISANESEISVKTGENISEVAKNIQFTNKKTVQHTCLTEEASKSLDSNNSNLISNKEIESTGGVDNKPVTKKGNMPLSKTKNPVLNQAIKNSYGSDSSMKKDYSVSEIKLPIQGSSANPTQEGECCSPLPMEIDDQPDKKFSNLETKSAPKSNPRLTTEEDRDFFILGINKEDFRPLVVPVPPPASVLSVNPNFFKTVPPTLDYFKNVPPPEPDYFKKVPPPEPEYFKKVPPPVQNVALPDPDYFKKVPPPDPDYFKKVPPPNLMCDPHITTRNFNVITNDSTNLCMPVSLSSHPSHVPNSKVPVAEFKSPTKGSSRTLIRINTHKDLFQPKSVVKSTAEEKSIVVSVCNPKNKCEKEANSNIKVNESVKKVNDLKNASQKDLDSNLNKESVIKISDPQIERQNERDSKAEEIQKDTDPKVDIAESVIKISDPQIENDNKATDSKVNVHEPIVTKINPKTVSQKDIDSEICVKESTAKESVLKFSDSQNENKISDSDINEPVIKDCDPENNIQKESVPKVDMNELFVKVSDSQHENQIVEDFKVTFISENTNSSVSVSEPINEKQDTIQKDISLAVSETVSSEVTDITERENVSLSNVRCNKTIVDALTNDEKESVKQTTDSLVSDNEQDFEPNQVSQSVIRDLSTGNISGAISGSNVINSPSSNENLLEEKNSVMKICNSEPKTTPQEQNFKPNQDIVTSQLVMKDSSLENISMTSLDSCAFESQSLNENLLGEKMSDIKVYNSESKTSHHNQQDFEQNQDLVISQIVIKDLSEEKSNIEACSSIYEPIQVESKLFNEPNQDTAVKQSLSKDSYEENISDMEVDAPVSDEILHQKPSRESLFDVEVSEAILEKNKLIDNELEQTLNTEKCLNKNICEGSLSKMEGNILVSDFIKDELSKTEENQNLTSQSVNEDTSKKNVFIMDKNITLIHKKNHIEDQHSVESNQDLVTSQPVDQDSEVIECVSTGETNFTQKPQVCNKSSDLVSMDTSTRDDLIPIAASENNCIKSITDIEICSATIQELKDLHRSQHVTSNFDEIISHSEDPTSSVNLNTKTDKTFNLDQKTIQTEVIKFKEISEESKSVQSQDTNEQDSSGEHFAGEGTFSSVPTTVPLNIMSEEITLKSPDSLLKIQDSVLNPQNIPDGTETLPLPPLRVTRSSSRILAGNVVAERSCSPSSPKINIDQEKLPFIQSSLEQYNRSPLSPQSSVIYDSEIDGQKDERGVFSHDRTGMKDVSSWLKGLRLHKYSYIFKNMTYEEMISITGEKLEKMNIPKGAQNKIILNISKLRERQGNLKNLEKDIQDGEGTILSILNKIQSMLRTPIKAFDSITSMPISVDNSNNESEISCSDPTSSPPSPTMHDDDYSQVVEGDLPGQMTCLLGKMCSKLSILPNPKENMIFVKIVDQCLSHEAFTPVQKQTLNSYKINLQKACQSSITSSLVP